MDAAERFAAAYGRAAAAYTAVLDPTLRPVAEETVRLADIDPSSRVLDLATGTGAVARVAVAGSASVMGVDVSAGMVELARALSPPEIEFVCADALDLPFGEEVVERTVDRSELYVCDEALLCGTAVQVVPLVEVDRRPVGDGRAGARTLRLLESLHTISRRDDDRHHDWTVPVWGGAE